MFKTLVELRDALVSLQRIKDVHVISVVCKSKVNGKLLFIRQNIQYFVSIEMLNVAFKAKGNGRDQIGY